MKCRVCNAESKFIFKAKILDKYSIGYYQCERCGFLETEEPYWLEESYRISINISDTGLAKRNIELSRNIAVFLYFVYGKNENYVDYAGGYGLFTRLMRDIGFNFYHSDLFTENLFATGFEAAQDKNYRALTTFESFEHFVNPIEEIEKMMKLSQNIIFTTELLPTIVPRPSQWWYYGLDHGQHISFYSIKTFRFIADYFKLNFITNKKIHLFSKEKINKKFNYLLMPKLGLPLFWIVTNKMRPRTLSDSQKLKGVKNS
jgi:hypothetical protein